MTLHPRTRRKHDLRQIPESTGPLCAEARDTAGEWFDGSRFPQQKKRRHIMFCCQRNKTWSPIVVGALLGVLSWVTFLTMDKALGTSTTMVHLAGGATSLVAPDHVKANPYYAKEISAKNPLFDWQFFLVLALPFGAALAAWLAKDRIV